MIIIGVDEAGRGPLVGSVVAAAVAFPENFYLEGLTDSKKLTEKKREYFYSKITQECLMLGIQQVKPGIHLGEIGKVIGTHAKSKNCSVVKDYCGHGIGLGFHELPQVIHYDDGKIEQSPILESGMTFTIEPMINLGGYEVITSKIDGWTVTTKDRSLSAQWEHTILVTETGYEILTIREEEKSQQL